MKHFKRKQKPLYQVFRDSTDEIIFKIYGLGLIVIFALILWNILKSKV